MDLNDPSVNIQEICAQNALGKTESLADIAKRAVDDNTEVVAAINGTFFNAYSSTSSEPYGHIINEGEMVHMASVAGSFGYFTEDNKFATDHIYVSVEGTIGAAWQYPYNWSVYAINHKTSSDYILTPYFGTNTGDCGEATIVVVENGTVSEIKQGKADIPENGYVIVLNYKQNAEKFKVGQRVDYRIRYHEAVFENGKAQKGELLDLDNIKAGLSAGPVLLIDGVVYADGAKEGITENKMNTLRAARSFIGVNRNNNRLIMGTVSNVTVKELAEIAKNMGLTDAVNLDGGASSGLYFKDKYLTSPGRKLSNALVITKSKAPVNEAKEVSFSFATLNDTIMVPLKNILKAADLDTITYKKYILIETAEHEIVLCVDDQEYWLDNERVSIDQPVTTINDEIYIPFELTELFGIPLEIDEEEGIVTINNDVTVIDPLKTFDKGMEAYNNQKYDEAEELFLQVLEADPGFSGAMDKLFRIYKDKKEHAKSVEYLEKFLSIHENDYSAMNALGWAYYSAKRYDDSLNQFIKMTEVFPDNPGPYETVGDMCQYQYFSNPEMAREYYRKALKLNLTDDVRNRISKKLSEVK